MGNVNWPLKDIRRDSFGNWYLEHIVNESFTVPAVPGSFGYYPVYLVEIPAPALLDGANAAPVIEVPIGSVLTIVDSIPSAAGEVFIDFNRGALLFHSGKAGLTGRTTYYGKGSLVESADLNDLNSRVDYIEANFQGEQGITGILGSTGVIGSQGQTGGPGLQGVTGGIGVTGMPGDRGSTGVRGQRGQTGLGPQGTTGLIGPTGIEGIGLSGSTGAAGVTGYPGPIGSRGATGLPAITTGRYQSVAITDVKNWEINHNLGDYPVVQAYGTNDKILDPDEIYNETVNRTWITFPEVTSGYAVCVIGGERGTQGSTGTRGLAGTQGATGLSTPPNARFKEVISAPSDAWVLDHHLGYEPIIQTFDGSGNLLTPTSIANGTETSTVTFSSPQVGYAIALSGGIRGETGLEGATGLRGGTGAQGEIGVQGGTGVRGITGALGTTGISGATGPQGVTGSRGLQGETGVQGSTGVRGITGFWGTTGTQGVTGHRGHTGLGERGPEGYIGATGIYGRQGVTGAGIQGITGDIGPTGLAGLRGATGPICNRLGMSLFMMNSGSDLTAGIAGDLRVLQDSTLKKGSLLAGETGSIQIDLWRSNFADFPPTITDSITNANPLEISGGIKTEDEILIGWDGDLQAGDIIRVNIISASGIKFCLLTLEASTQ